MVAMKTEAIKTEATKMEAVETEATEAIATVERTPSSLAVGFCKFILLLLRQFAVRKGAILALRTGAVVEEPARTPFARVF